MNYERLYVLKSVSELGQKYIYIKIGNVERSVEHFLLMCFFMWCTLLIYQHPDKKILRCIYTRMDT